MRALNLGWRLGLLLALSGCAGSQRRPPVEEIPDYSDEAIAEARIKVVSDLLDAGQADAALSAINQLKAAGSAGLKIEQLTARALVMKGLYEEALSILESRRHQRAAESWRLRGLAEASSQRPDEALLSFELALRYLPRKGSEQVAARIHNNLGFVHAAMEDHEIAVADFRAALKLDPTLIRARNNMGMSLAALLRDEEALAAFRAAGGMLLDSSSAVEADAWYNLGVARELRGDRAGARDSYLQSLTHLPDQPLSRQALARLKPTRAEE